MPAASPAPRRRRLALAAGFAVVTGSGGLVAWYVSPPAATQTTVGRLTAHPRSTALAALRRSMDAAALDAFVVEQQQRAESAGDASEWRVLAEACLERVLLASSRLGMEVGRPTFASMPPEVAASLALGEEAIAKARSLGDLHSEVARIGAGLLANRIDGALAAMRLGRRVDELVAEADAAGDGNPHVAVLRGCRLVFAPKWLGGDPSRALALFEAAAEAMPDDERPLVFAAFAAHLLGDGANAREHLQAAVARNPRNAYAREVLRRLEAGEDDPFGRDLPPP